jgi:hypothetical protein
VFDQGAANPAQWGRFRARLANIGAAVAPGGELAGAPSALAADAIVADSNTIIALRSLIAGRAVWHGTAGSGQTTLARNERAAITRLRQLTGQLPPAAPHTGTAPVAEVDTVPLQPTVAEAQALLNRVANTNVGMMELGPGAPGQPGRGTAFGIDVDRASPEYAAMLTELAVPPQQPWKKGKSSAALGKGGVRDHGMLADALFATRASPTDIPVFLTVDDDVFVRLSGFAEKSGSGFVDFRMPAKPQPGFKEARLLAATNPQGYTILVRGQRLRVVYGTP